MLILRHFTARQRYAIAYHSIEQVIAPLLKEHLPRHKRGFFVQCETRNKRNRSSGTSMWMTPGLERRRPPTSPDVASGEAPVTAALSSAVEAVAVRMKSITYLAGLLQNRHRVSWI
jgi:hypothetical protein